MQSLLNYEDIKYCFYSYLYILLTMVLHIYNWNLYLINRVSLNVANEIKEKSCYVASNYKEELEKVYKRDKEVE